MAKRKAKERKIPSITIISLTVAIVSIVVSGLISLSLFGLDSRFQGLQDSINSFRIGLTDQINALRSDLERIEKIVEVLEQRMDISSSEAAINNQLLKNVTDRIKNIEQSLNQSQPSLPSSPLPISLSISYPSTGNEVDWITSVTGTSTGVATNKTLGLYLLVYPMESEGPWFVQNRPTVNPDGSWSGMIYFGRNPDMHPQDVGDRFILRAVVATTSLQPGITLTESQIPEIVVQTLIAELVRK